MCMYSDHNKKWERSHVYESKPNIGEEILD